MLLFKNVSSSRNAPARRTRVHRTYCNKRSELPPCRFSGFDPIILHLNRVQLRHCNKDPTIFIKNITLVLFQIYTQNAFQQLMRFRWSHSQINVWQTLLRLPNSAFCGCGFLSVNNLANPAEFVWTLLYLIERSDDTSHVNFCN